jgi:transcriptional regulator with XRE-family HTH domain
METIGDRVRRTREGKGIARGDLARAVGLSYTGLSDLESGKAKTTTKLHRLATELGVAVEWLETGKGSPTPRQAAPEQVSRSVRLDPEIVRDVAEILQKLYKDELKRDFVITDEPEVFVDLYQRTVERGSTDGSLFWLGTRVRQGAAQGAEGEQSKKVDDRGHRKRNAGPSKA